MKERKKTHFQLNCGTASLEIRLDFRPVKMRENRHLGINEIWHLTEAVQQPLKEALPLPGEQSEAQRNSHLLQVK